RAARGSASGNGHAGRRDERVVVGHHAIRLDDVGVGLVSLGAQPRSERVELGDDERKSALDARPLVVDVPRCGIVAVDAGPGGPERGARRSRVAAKSDFGHGASWTARSRAATTIATDVAPGSWCPTERSPRYEARPLRATIGTVARIPSSAAAR